MMGGPKSAPPTRPAAVIVAHPDDELLWAGGTILTRLDWQWEICALCRASDADRAPRFKRILRELGAGGAIGDLDDGAGQAPLEPSLARRAIVSLLQHRRFHIVLTHGPQGEYTRHRRHEETCRAVVRLWSYGMIDTGELWMFAYTDSNGQRLPVAVSDAHRYEELPEDAWKEKCRLLTEVYGFAPESWEARTAPRAEAFWCFDTPDAASAWIAARGSICN
ncbi:MAG: PIG-L family deacetylase [Sedimentisphaerales bacterium]|nr:PIG-L family deacetylase [Sedimentisphaerales bacterium]